MKIHRSLTALILSFGFLFVVMLLLGGNPVPIVQAAPVARPVLAPQPVGVDPARNALNVPLTNNISISFDEPIAAASVTSRTLVVHGSQSPVFTGTYSLSNLSRTVTLDPSRSFFPGEVINASVTTATLNITGEHIITPTVWQFWAAAHGGTGRFAAHPISPTFGADSSTASLLGDVDGDGDLDALVANYGQAETVWLNDGTGRFTLHTFFGANDHSTAIVLGDVDGDGDLDALVANEVSEAETVWLNNGAGVFTPHPVSPTFGTGDSLGIALGDIDSDGDVDAVVANANAQAETVWLNDGTGRFTAHPTTPSFGAEESLGIALGDVDGDGDLDALVANYFPDQPETVWLNDGNGNFAPHPTAPAFGGGDSQAITLGDLDDDGDLDAIIANYLGDEETVWLNDGTGRFTAHPTTPSFGVGSSSGDIALGDVDSDGDLDALVANYGQAETVWLNDGVGDFAAHPTMPSFGADDDSLGIALGDVDGDGDLDVLVANYSGQAETVWLNEDQAADLIITKTASPEPAIAGTSLFYTITVANQGTGTATNVVVSDTLPPSTTLTTVDQTDDDGSALGFGGGTYQNTQWTDPRPAVNGDEWLTLIDPLLATGVFTSRAIDAGNIVSWTSLAWTPQRPYGKPLPNNRGVEAAYPLGDANMLGDRVLLHLDEATSSTIFTDTSGLNNNGVCPATTGESCPTAGAAGRFNQALNFAGALSQTMAISEVVDPARYAIELWVNPTIVTDTSFILRTDALSGTATNYSQLLGIFGNRFVHLLNDGGVKAITSTPIITPNTWYHVVGTAESNGDMKLYVNGVLQATLNGVGTVWTGGDQYRLGSSYGSTGTRYFSGRLDEVAIYTRTLSAGEVLDHYLRGALRLSFEARSCDDVACTGEAFGSTIYSEQSNATLGLPSIALNGVPDNRYFQYRATLITDDPAYAPALHSVTVDPPHPNIMATQGNCAAPAPDRFSCALGDIAGGGLVTITTEVFVDPSALGIITNTAFVTTTAPITNPLNDATFVTTTVIARSDLSIDKYDDSDLHVVNPGSILTYHLDVYNGGPSTALSPTITDTLPASMFGFASGNGWTCISGNTITCTRPSLNVYQWSAIDITATAPITQGWITNTAWISSPVTPDPDLANNHDTQATLVIPLADLVIEKTANPDPVDPGAVLTYTIVVTNNGPYTATNVIVTDTLPSGFTGYPIGGAGWSCGAPGNNVICSLLTPLTPTFSARFNITLTAPLSGFLMNMAQVSSAIFDPEPDNNFAIAYTAVRRVADLSIVKSDNPDPVEANSLLTYTLSITNAGPVSAGVLTNTLSFNNPRAIDIPWAGRAGPYPSELYLTSIDGVVQNITLTLNNFSHTYPGDVSALLVGPNGQTVMLMSNAIGGIDVNNVTLRFNDAGVNLPLSGTITSTVVYRPTSYGLTGDLADPAPAGPYGGNLSAFRGSSPNGLWQLYVYDNVDSDGGLIVNGWSLQLTTVTTDTVNVTDTLSNGVTFINATGPGWLCNYAGGEVGCEVDSLPIGRAPDITLVISAPLNGGLITNTASITSTTADFTLGNNTSTITTTVLSVADLSITKAASSDPVLMSAVFTYTVTISNAGPSTNMPVTVTDVLPGSATYLRHVASGWTCTVASNIVTCAVLGMALGTQTIQIAVTAPALAGVITNTASITSTVRDPYPLNNTASITTTIADIPIAGLVATNDSPTVIGQPTTFQATITAGSNVTYLWNFGDGTAPVSGNPVTHTYALTGTYTAIVTATNSVSVMTATTRAIVIPLYKIYMPLVMRYYGAPDLVVSSINVTSNTVQVVIKNQGGPIPVDVDHEFWVDLYVNPNPPPTAVNHIWQDGRSTQGVVWGVTVDALPSLRAGGTFTLTLNDAYYWPTLSNFAGGLLAGTPIYAQVDSAHTASPFGGVLENHEIAGLPYNNITGPVMVP